MKTHFEFSRQKSKILNFKGVGNLEHAKSCGKLILKPEKAELTINWAIIKRADIIRDEIIVEP